MKKSLFEIAIEKVGAGDKSFIPKLAMQLTDRLCYIPAVSVSKEGTTHKISVVRISREGRSVVPFFTSEKLLQSWATAENVIVAKSIDLLGGDLCTVLGPEVGVVINPGAAISAELSAHEVKEVARRAQAKADQEARESLELSAPLDNEEVPLPQHTSVNELDPTATAEVSADAFPLLQSSHETIDTEEAVSSTAQPPQKSKKGLFGFLGKKK
jgi:hypothetical protein